MPASRAEASLKGMCCRTEQTIESKQTPQTRQQEQQNSNVLDLPQTELKTITSCGDSNNFTSKAGHGPTIGSSSCLT